MTQARLRTALLAASFWALGAPASQADAAAREAFRLAGAQRECFEEGPNQRDCVDLKLGCADTDTACLTDDLTGSIIRAGRDSAERYAGYLARGIVALNAGQIGDALADFEAARSIRPRLVAPLVLAGQAHAAASQHARALAALDEAVRRVPQAPLVLASRAGVRQQAGDLDGAIEDLTYAIALVRGGQSAPAAHEPLENLLVARGMVWLAKRDAEKARGDFAAALAAKPGYAPARAALEQAQ